MLRVGATALGLVCLMCSCTSNQAKTNQGSQCTNECQAGQTHCNGTQEETCGLDSSGCTVWGAPMACSAGGTCDASLDHCVSDPCMGVPSGGQCANASTVEFCVPVSENGAPTVRTVTCPSGYSCAIQNGFAECVSSGVCSDGQTQCTPDQLTLQTCRMGQWVNTTCPHGCESQLNGSACAPPTTGTVRLTGTVTYNTHLPNASRTDWSSTPTPLPLPNAIVVSYVNNDILDAQVTNASGDFSLQVPMTPAPTDLLAVVAVAGDQNGNVLFMVADPDLMQGEATAPSLGSMPHVWGWSWPLDMLQSNMTLNIDETHGSGAAHLYDFQQKSILQANHFYQKNGLTNVAWWSPGVTWDCGACFAQYQVFVGDPAIPFQSQIFFGGNQTDQDYWADAPIAHEFGHWAMASFGVDPDEGGPHFLGQPTFPGQAWSEGWATFWSSDLRQDPVYLDKQEGSMFWFDLSKRQYSGGQTWQRPTPDGGLLQEMDENEVSATLWNLSHATNMADAPILSALSSARMIDSPWARGYTRHTWDVDKMGNISNVVDTGVSKPALPDMLDALVCEGFNPTAVEAVTQPLMHYPYPSNAPICR